MKVLILAEDYPNNNGGISLMYIHTRNLYYQKNGIDVEVLNFRATEDYVFENIPVITIKSYKEKNKKYDLLIIHAANVKHHYCFLKRYGNRFRKFIFFYHGHEVLKINKVYSKPYYYVNQSKPGQLLQDIYDDFKLYIWKKYLPKVAYKSEFVFVSEWMKNEFFKWTKINESKIENHCHITYNCVGEIFEKMSYNDNSTKKYDFVTIRGNLDGSKYSIDIVNRLAKNTPNRKFLVVGKGEFFEYFKKADNVEWKNQTMNHEEIIKTLDEARFALMPTRTDAQGLMMCEMAAYGIPLITSDIPVCHEVFDDFDNVYFINNDNDKESLEKYASKKSACKKDHRFFKDITIQKELNLIKRTAE